MSFNRKHKFPTRKTCWTYLNLRNGSQLRANKQNGIIQIWYLDDYGDHPSKELKCSKDETARNILMSLALHMQKHEYYQFEWSIDCLVNSTK